MVFGLLSPRAAYADPPRAVLEAWTKKDFNEAERLARRAIEDGSLTPREVVDTYVYLGAARAQLSKKAPAIAAFRAAGALNSDFSLPDDAGAKAIEFANQARADVASIGSIALTAQIPKRVDDHTAFVVKATLDNEHLTMVKKMEIIARDGTSGREYHEETQPGELVEFRVPADLTLTGAVLKVRVDALDRFKNRLASVEERVDVNGRAADRVAAPDPLRGDERKKKKGGFWTSPWPYIVGGALLLAAGSGSAYYFWLRPPDVVTVEAPRLTVKR